MMVQKANQMKRCRIFDPPLPASPHLAFARSYHHNTKVGKFERKDIDSAAFWDDSWANYHTKNTGA
jgi:hypothetical protein